MLEKYGLLWHKLERWMSYKYQWNLLLWKKTVANRAFKKNIIVLAEIQIVIIFNAIIVKVVCISGQF